MAVNGKIDQVSKDVMKQTRTGFNKITNNPDVIKQLIKNSIQTLGKLQIGSPTFKSISEGLGVLDKYNTNQLNTFFALKGVIKNSLTDLVNIKLGTSIKDKNVYTKRLLENAIRESIENMKTIVIGKSVGTISEKLKNAIDTMNQLKRIAKQFELDPSDANKEELNNQLKLFTQIRQNIIDLADTSEENGLTPFTHTNNDIQYEWDKKIENLGKDKVSTKILETMKQNRQKIEETLRHNPSIANGYIYKILYGIEQDNTKSIGSAVSSARDELKNFLKNIPLTPSSSTSINPRENAHSHILNQTQSDILKRVILEELVYCTAILQTIESDLELSDKDLTNIEKNIENRILISITGYDLKTDEKLSLYDIITSLINEKARGLHLNLINKVDGSKDTYNAYFSSYLDKIDDTLIQKEYDDNKFNRFKSELYTTGEGKLKENEFFNKIQIARENYTNENREIILLTILIIWNDFRSRFKVLENIQTIPEYISIFNQMLTSFYVAFEEDITTPIVNMDDDDGDDGDDGDEV